MKTGRNKVTIDWAWVDEHLRAGCDGKGIAGLLGIHANTLYRRCEEEKGMTFSDYQAQKRAEGDELLRKVQWDMAMQGDKTMVIWLGKQRLGQSERTDNKHEVIPTIQIDTTYVSDETKRRLEKIGQN